MWARIARRLLPVVLGAALYASSAQSASAVEVCTPAPKVDASFCVDPSLTLLSTTPGDPLSFDLSAADTSTNFSSDGNEWVQTAVLDLQSSGGLPVAITPSASMPAGLLISNSPSCTAPSYSDCAGGHGVFAGVVSGTLLFDGYHEGTFGVNRITNVQAAGAGNLARYHVSFSYHVPLPSPFPDINSSYGADIVVPDSGATTGSVVIPIHASLTESSAMIEATLKSFSLHLDGESNMTEGGPADQMYRIFSVPSCGAWSAGATFISGDARELSLQQSLTLPACPLPPSTATSLAPTGQRAAALKKCKKKKGTKRKKCIKRAKKLPV